MGVAGGTANCRWLHGYAPQHRGSRACRGGATRSGGIDFVGANLGPLPSRYHGMVGDLGYRRFGNAAVRARRSLFASGERRRRDTCTDSMRKSDAESFLAYWVEPQRQPLWEQLSQAAPASAPRNIPSLPMPLRSSNGAVRLGSGSLRAVTCVGGHRGFWST